MTKYNYIYNYIFKDTHLEQTILNLTKKRIFNWKYTLKRCFKQYNVVQIIYQQSYRKVEWIGLFIGQIFQKYAEYFIKTCLVKIWVKQTT